MQERVAQNLLVADQEKITAIRDEFPVLQNLVFLNAGTNGPIPRRSHDALVQYAQTELTEGRVGLATFMRLFELWGQLRASVATILGCDPAEIALTHNTTEGITSPSWASTGKKATNWSPPARSTRAACIRPTSS